MEIQSILLNAPEAVRKADPRQMPALTLAYLGDTVYDLFVRSRLAFADLGNVHTLHTMAAKLVCAKGQATAYYAIKDRLTEEETAAFKRGRNAHSGTVPKHADIQDYRVATGLEALLGHLYCLGQDERIAELMDWALEATIEVKEQNHGIRKI